MVSVAVLTCREVASLQGRRCCRRTSSVGGGAAGIVGAHLPSYLSSCNSVPVVYYMSCCFAPSGIIPYLICIYEKTNFTSGTRYYTQQILDKITPDREPAAAKSVYLERKNLVFFMIWCV